MPKPGSCFLFIRLPCLLRSPADSCFDSGFRLLYITAYFEAECNSSSVVTRKRTREESEILNLLNSMHLGIGPKQAYCPKICQSKVSSALLLRDALSKSIARRKTDQVERAEMGRALEALVDSSLIIKELSHCSECSFAETELELLDCVKAQCPAQLTQIVASKVAKRSDPSNTVLSTSSLGSMKSKRWHYSDHLQLCIKANCQGKSGDLFFACVYDHCFSTN
ncbi:hypothetical protein CAPTEDRAFT_188333 [Capitella teleta]|uniref:Uncharacterized protein n=1 Tax=Capitella teleta TaxID=283909 RepID=R7VMA4_CAPTE|nr:hypothetical protein CAPTEDRAFT_188333 [Capitella teleta]|eukprot:ELU18495.1 hypothetical protein CAPTEDRAFT_188333 [Capitella teleta]